MFGLLIQWLLSTLTLLAVSMFLPGFYVTGLWPALIASLAIGLLNAMFGYFLKAVNFPFAVVIFGGILLAVNALLILVASRFVNGFDVHEHGPALWGGAVMALLGLVSRAYLKEA